MPTPRCSPVTHVDRRDFTAQAELLKALANPYRLKIIATIVGSEDPVCVCDLTDGLPIRQSSVSHHLAILRDAGILVSERRGTWAFYSIAPGVRARVLAAVDAAIPGNRLVPVA